MSNACFHFIVLYNSWHFCTRSYRVILCFFRRFSNIPDSGLSLFSLAVSVCTHTRQVVHQCCRRTGRVQKKSQNFKEKHNNYEHLEHRSERTQSAPRSDWPAAACWPADAWDTLGSQWHVTGYRVSNIPCPNCLYKSEQLTTARNKTHKGLFQALSSLYRLICRLNYELFR